MKDERFCFVAVEFPDDPNVCGFTYWYRCGEEVAVGNTVTAPLGRHNKLQRGIVRKVRFATQAEAPFPFEFIKDIYKVADGTGRQYEAL